MKTPRITEQTKAAKKRAFLAAFVETASVTHACKILGISRATHYDWLEEDPAYKEQFGKSLNMAADHLEDECLRRGYRGIQKPVLYQGKLCYREEPVLDPFTGQPVRDPLTGEMNFVRSTKPLIIREYSDNLAMFMLKGMRPEKYRENWKGEISGAGGGPIDSHLTITFVKPA